MIDVEPNWSTIAIRYLDKNMPDKARVLEWGSGRSSVWLARRAQFLVTVEHAYKWVAITDAFLREADVVDRVKLLYCPPDREVGSAPPLYWDVEGRSMGAYVKDGARTAEKAFRAVDLVCVDGRARAGCVHLAMALVPVGGMLLLDDAERSRYQSAIRELEKNRFVPLLEDKPRDRKTQIFVREAAS